MINPCVEIEWDSGSEKYSIFSIQFPDHQSKPFLYSVPELTRAISFDHSIENSTLTIELSDHNLYFSQKEEEVLFGKKVMLYNDGYTLFTGWVAEPPKTSNRIFKIKADIYTLLKTPINKAITKDVFSVPSEFDGTYGNIIIGNSTEGWFTAKRVDTNTYLAAWNPLSEITKAKTKDGVDIDLNDINLLVQNNQSFIEYTSTDSFLYFAAKGPIEGSQLIENPIKMFKYILQNHTALEIEDLTEIEELYENRNYPFNHLFITDDSTIGEFFGQFSESFGAKPVISMAGKVGLKPIKWGEQTYKASIRPTQIIDFQKWKEYKYMRKAWNRYYAFDPSQQKYSYSPQDLVATQAWSNEIGKFRHKFLLQDPSSKDVGLREKYLREAPLLFQGFKVPLSIIQENSVDNGDIVRFSHRESFFPDEERLMQVLRIRNEKKSSFFYIEGFDISTTQEKTLWVYEEGNPNNPWVYEDGNPRNPLAWFRY
jgi:hypothetical protein